MTKTLQVELLNALISLHHQNVAARFSGLEVYDPMKLVFEIFVHIAKYNLIVCLMNKFNDLMFDFLFVFCRDHHLVTASLMKICN